jgi:hypothetical protein
MKKIIFLCLSILLSSCATSLVLTGQDKCAEENGDTRGEISQGCRTLNELIDAVASDAKAVKEIGEIIRDEHLTEDNGVPPSHVGEDSNLCEVNETKTCSISNGCKCSS